MDSAQQLRIHSQRLAQSPNMDLECVVLDDGVRPDGRHQLVLGDQRAFSLGEHGQKVKRLATDGNRSAVIQQLTKWLQGEPANAVFPTIHHKCLRYGAMSPDNCADGDICACAPRISGKFQGDLSAKPRTRCAHVHRVRIAEFSVSPASGLGGHSIENASPGRANAARSDLFFRLVAWLTLNPAGERLAPQALIRRDRFGRTHRSLRQSCEGRRQTRLKETKMPMSTRSLLMATAVLAASWVFAPAAWAGCGVNATALKKHASWTSQDN